MRKLNPPVNRIFRFNEKSQTLVSTYSLFPAVPCLLRPLSQLTFVTAFRSLTSSRSHCSALCTFAGFFSFPFSPSSIHPIPSDFHSICYTSQDGCPHSNQQAIKQNLTLPGVPTLTLISRPCSSSPILLSFLCWLQHTDTFPSSSCCRLSHMPRVFKVCVCACACVHMCTYVCVCVFVCFLSLTVIPCTLS